MSKTFQHSTVLHLRLQIKNREAFGEDMIKDGQPMTAREYMETTDFLEFINNWVQENTTAEMLNPGIKATGVVCSNDPVNEVSENEVIYPMRRTVNLEVVDETPHYFDEAKADLDATADNLQIHINTVIENAFIESNPLMRLALMLGETPNVWEDAEIKIYYCDKITTTPTE